MTTEYSSFEWDRPGVGLYDKGQIRIITSRMPDGSVGACHMATAEEVRWVTLCETVERGMSNLVASEPKSLPPLPYTAKRWGVSGVQVWSEDAVRKYARNVIQSSQISPDTPMGELKDWLMHELPVGTVIGNPAWWADRIVQRAQSLLNRNNNGNS